MHNRFFRRIVLPVVVFVAVGYGGYDVYQRYVAYTGIIQRDRARAAEIESNRARTNKALVAAGVDTLQVNRGFWYTVTDEFGGQSVFYFDGDAWSLKENLSDMQISELANTVASSTVVDRTAMQSVPDGKLPPELQFHNSLYSNKITGQFQNTQDALKGRYEKGVATAPELWGLSYMYELQGNYAKRDEVNAVSCKKYAERCAGQITVSIHGTVRDIAGNPVQGARVTVLSHPGNAGATTDEAGAYSIELGVLPVEKVRIGAVKRNFSNGVANLIVLNAGRRVHVAEPIVLGTPITIVTIDTVKHTVTGPDDSAAADGSFVLHATSSTYEIPAGAIVNKTGKPYAGQVDVYLYEFTRDTVPQSLISIDTFDQVVGYAGDLMKSYGMPYIQFFAADGTELDVRSSKPMVLTYKIPAMNELRANADDNPAGPLTTEQMQRLLAASQSGGFPITRTFLVEQKLYTFPPFWVFDRGSGVWDNVGIRVLDTSGIIQAPFYTTK